MRCPLCWLLLFSCRLFAVVCCVVVVFLWLVFEGCRKFFESEKRFFRRLPFAFWPAQMLVLQRALRAMQGFRQAYSATTPFSRRYIHPSPASRGAVPVRYSFSRAEARRHHFPCRRERPVISEPGRYGRSLFHN